MYSVETFDTIKRFLTFSLTKPIENAEVMLKQYELCIYGDMHTVTKFILLNVLKTATPQSGMGIALLYVFVIFSTFDE